MTVLCSNPVIKGKIVRWDLLKPFESTREAASILKENNGEFEPVVQTDKSSKNGYSNTLSPVWGPWIDKVQPSLKNYNSLVLFQVFEQQKTSLSASFLS